jgi:hypothetical protein
MNDRFLRRFQDSLALGLSLLSVLMVVATGCKVQVDKSSDGGGDNVKIATPFGEIAVNKNQTSSADVGLPAYPGAALETGGDGNKSARVDMGFGSWKLRVRVANYSTPDKRDKVLAFYRNALSEYGGVIECAGDKPVGTKAVTGDGLTCDHSDHDHISVQGSISSDDLQLKAGSPRHQHIVSFKGDGASATTHFSLIALDLPHGVDDEQKGTN